MSNQPTTTDLNKLILFTGLISEVHVKNLQSYPFIFFNDISDAKLNYAVEIKDRANPTLFCYDLTLNMESNDQLDIRYKALEKAVKSLFWAEARVEIKINGEEVYKSD